VEELRQLYPEEMNAYRKWVDMHDEYKVTKENLVAEDDCKDELATTLPSEEGAVGHLHERSAQFDVRTDRMPSEWYSEFTDLRQGGSFLPRFAGKKTTDEKAWEDSHADKKRGRRKEGLWENMSTIAIRFLHWVGFDVETLPPPNDDTTNALAYLGYDFFGRIVEQAIFLRNCDTERKAKGSVDETNILLELGKGEQLLPADIERAIKAINPVPLYSAETEKKVEPQLYFGPGFEERLEMELEEIMQEENRVTLTDEELKIRREEDELFSKLAKTDPQLNGIASLLDVEVNREDSKLTSASSPASANEVSTESAEALDDKSAKPAEGAAESKTFALRKRCKTDIASDDDKNESVPKKVKATVPKEPESKSTRRSARLK
jgi:hypothetical protein